MDTCFEKGIAFILEGDTEKVFYTTLLSHLCTKHSGVTFVKNTDSASGEIFYTLGTSEKKVLIMFNIYQSYTFLCTQRTYREVPQDQLALCFHRF